MIIPIGYAQVNLRFTGTAVPTGAEMTFGLDIGGIPGTLTALADEIADAWDTQGCQARQNDQCVLATLLVKEGPNITGPSVEISPGLAGGQSGEAGPPNTAALVRKVTSDGGRAGRGRMYFPGVTEGNMDHGGIYDPTERGLLEVALENFRNVIDVYGAPWVVLHASGSPISTPSPITALEVDGRLATQRRRLRR
jgi:hypothetical protein